MPGFVFADADRASYRTVQRRREEDLEFLAWLRTAALEELDRKCWETARTKSFPQWKRVALARAIARHGAG